MLTQYFVSCVHVRFYFSLLFFILGEERSNSCEFYNMPKTRFAEVTRILKQRCNIWLGLYSVHVCTICCCACTNKHAMCHCAVLSQYMYKIREQEDK